MRRSVLVTAVVLAASGVVAPSAAAAQGYVILRPLPGDAISSTVALNDSGDVVGTSSAIGMGKQHAVRWNRDGKPTKLPELRGGSSLVSGMNNHGVVIGTAMQSDNDWRAVVWSGGKITALPTRQDVISPHPYEINDAGVIVGEANVEGQRQAVKWVAGKYSELPLLPGTLDSVAEEINERGEIAGTMTMPDRGIHVVRWDAQGHITDFGDFGGGGYTVLGEMNENGVLSGYSSTPSGGVVPFRSNASGGLDALATLAGGDAYAGGINDSGEVVGTAYLAQFDYASVRWGSDGTLTRLEELPPEYLNQNHGVSDVNNAGVAVGSTGGHAARWDHEGRLTSLPFLPGREAYAGLVNESGVIAGYGVNQDIHSVGVLWR